MNVVCFVVRWSLIVRSDAVDCHNVRFELHSGARLSVRCGLRFGVRFGVRFDDGARYAQIAHSELDIRSDTPPLFDSDSTSGASTPDSACVYAIPYHLR